MTFSGAERSDTVAVLAALVEAVDGVVELAVSLAADGAGTRRPADLLETLMQATAAVGRLQGAQLVVAEQVEIGGAAATTGWASTRDLLTHLTGGRKGTGGGILRLAEQTAALPQVRSAMLAGDLSPAQARTIARRVTTLPASPGLRTEAASIMVGQVRDAALDASDLDRSFETVLHAVDPDGSLLGDESRRPQHERAAHRARHLSLVPDEVGGVRITGYAGIEDAELVRTSLAPLAAPRTTEPGACGGEGGISLVDRRRREQAGETIRRCPDPTCRHDGRDPRAYGTRLLDALVETCRRSQADTGPQALPRAHGTSARIVVTLDHDDLVETLGRARPRGTGLLGSGQRLSAHAVRRLACDAEILPAVLGGEGQILDLGRTQRLVTTSMWLGVVVRDRHCTFPGCTRPPEACEAHHVVHWADGGATALDNLVLLCRHHHTVTHHSPWAVSVDPSTRRPVWTPPPRSAQPLEGRIAPPVPAHPPPLRVPA